MNKRTNKIVIGIGKWEAIVLQAHLNQITSESSFSNVIKFSKRHLTFKRLLYLTLRKIRLKKDFKNMKTL